MLVGGFGGYACLTDFGVSALGASSLPFLAPEGHRGDAVGARSDCLRLGCVLFQALAGRPPFAHNTDIEIIRAHLAYPPPALSATCDDVPAALDAVVSRALSKRPEDRHATAGELAAEAAAALHRRARQGSPTLPAQPAFTRRPAGRSHGRSRGAPGASPGPCWLLRSLAALPPPRS
jgi:serine/threonine protein kinase